MTFQSSAITEKWLQVLKARYNEVERHYHTLSHVRHMLSTLAKLQSDKDLTLIDEAAVELAIWFHDAIYLPKADHGESEQQSAEFLDTYEDYLRKELADENCNLKITVPEPSIFAKAHRMIMCTVSHKLPSDGSGHDTDYEIFLDLDLAILAEDEEIYDAYAVKIRKEYEHFDDEAFRKGRLGVLQRFLERETLYFSNIGRKLWEDKARSNIRREIQKLQE